MLTFEFKSIRNCYYCILGSIVLRPVAERVSRCTTTTLDGNFLRTLSEILLVLEEPTNVAELINSWCLTLKVTAFISFIQQADVWNNWNRFVQLEAQAYPRAALAAPTTWEPNPANQVAEPEPAQRSLVPSGAAKYQGYQCLVSSREAPSILILVLNKQLKFYYTSYCDFYLLCTHAWWTGVFISGKFLI